MLSPSNAALGLNNQTVDLCTIPYNVSKGFSESNASKLLYNNDELDFIGTDVPAEYIGAIKFLYF